VTLYDDDNSTGTHTPGNRLTTPYQITVTAFPLLTNKGQWYQQDISTAGWPHLLGTTYYWVALTPAAPVSMANGQYNGVVWVGFDDTTPNVNLIGQYTGDDNVFKARQLTSQRTAADSAFYANTPAAVNFLASQQQWSSVPFANVRYTDFDAAGSHVRYGIQLTGFQVSPLLAHVSCMMACLGSHVSTLSHRLHLLAQSASFSASVTCLSNAACVHDLYVDVVCVIFADLEPLRDALYLCESDEHGDCVRVALVVQVAVIVVDHVCIAFDDPFVFCIRCRSRHRRR